MWMGAGEGQGGSGGTQNVTRQEDHGREHGEHGEHAGEADDRELDKE